MRERHSSVALAVDVGGTKLAAAIVDAGGTILHRAQAATPSGDDPAAFAEALEGAVHQVLDLAPPDLPDRLVGLGVGSAGPLDPVAGTVSPVNIPALRGFPILDLLRAVLPDRPAALAGDAHCMALGEYRFGVARGSRAMLGMVVSTGVGGGFVLDGQLLPGVTGNAGHVGHIVVDLAGPACPCGSKGCVEMLASGPNLVRWAVQQGWRGSDSPALAADARAGHPVARRAFARGAAAVAAAIVNSTALVDLDDVVIGGGVAQAGDVLFDPLGSALAELAGLEFVRRVRVHRSGLGVAAGLLGAAALAFVVKEPPRVPQNPHEFSSGPHEPGRSHAGCRT